MTDQAKGALIAFAFVAAFIASILLHSVVASVVVLLSGVTVAYVSGIAWMRTSSESSRIRGKQRSLP
jgi:biotin transporter BioY